MQGHKMYKLGISIAASWAWGVSLGVSYDILQTMGVKTFIPWAACNTLALSVFGVFANKYPAYLKLRHALPVKAAMIGIQIFCIWINIKIMGAYVGNRWATVITIIVFVLTYLYKFPFSVESDQWQYAAMVGALLLIVLTGNRDIRVTANLPADIKWLVPACLGLLAGPFIDGQQFQRAKETKSIKPWIIGSVGFGAYLLLVFISHSTTSHLSNVLISITIIAVATSTLDSCIASLQDLTSDTWAIVISLSALAVWPLFLSKTATQIWAWYATARIFIVIPMIAYTIREEKRWKSGKKTNTL